MKQVKEVKNLPYYFKNTDIKTLFYAASLLDDKDIIILIKKFGSSLKEDLEISIDDIDRLFYIINKLLPASIKDYQNFTTSLPVFLNISNEEVTNLINTLTTDEKALVFMLFDKESYTYKNNNNINITLIKQVYNILKNALNKEKILLTALLTGVERRTYQKCDKKSNSYKYVINEVLPKKAKEYKAICTNLSLFFERYTKYEIKTVLSSLKALKNFPLYDYYDEETLDFIYNGEMTYDTLYNLYGFLVYTLKASLSLRYHGRTKEYNSITKKSYISLNFRYLNSYHIMAKKIGYPLAAKIADNISASKGNLKVLTSLSNYTLEEYNLLTNGKDAIMKFIEEYLSAISAIKEQNKQDKILSDF